jgi:DNA-binding NarL/FixJ family response regulator
MIDVAAVDDHPIILDSIAGWVSGPDNGIRVIATAGTVDGLPTGPGRHAHVVLLDLDLGDGTTAERNVAVIRAAGPAVLVLAASDKPVSARDAIRAGALGYVLKTKRLRRFGRPLRRWPRERIGSRRAWPTSSPLTTPLTTPLTGPY